MPKKVEHMQVIWKLAQHVFYLLIIYVYTYKILDIITYKKNLTHKLKIIRI